MCLLPAPSPARRLVPGPLCGLLVKLPLGCVRDPPHTLAAVLQPLPAGPPAPARHRALGEVEGGGQGPGSPRRPRSPHTRLGRRAQVHTQCPGSQKNCRGEWR